MTDPVRPNDPLSGIRTGRLRQFIDIPGNVVLQEEWVRGDGRKWWSEVPKINHDGKRVDQESIVHGPYCGCPYCTTKEKPNA